MKSRACLYNTESFETTDNSPGLPDPTKRLLTAPATQDPITGKMGGGQTKRVTFPVYNVEIRPQTILTLTIRDAHLFLGCRGIILVNVHKQYGQQLIVIFLIVRNEKSS